MRVLLQRVKRASVTIDNEICGKINQGLLIFIGVHSTDTNVELEWMVKKCLGLRIFSDNEGKMNLSVQDIEGEILIVSQFTLYGNAQKGFRPGFTEAAPPELAIPIYEKFVEKMKQGVAKVATGKFGADMDVELINDGPVTIWLERNAQD